MKNLPDGMQAALDRGATTLCHCWLLVRKDGARLGFTDHDRDLAFGGDTFEAASGFTASAMEASAGMAASNLEASGGLDSDKLSADDLAAGLYDDAEVTIWRVNWLNPDQRLIVKRGNLGEVSRGETGFIAEIRGLGEKLQEAKGRVYSYNCDVDLGSAKCGVSLESPSFKGSGTILAAASRRQVIASGLDGFAPGWFDGGYVTFTSGANQGLTGEVKAHGLTGSPPVADLDFWLPMPYALAPGDAFEITAGCDKSFDTCKAKFGNAANFRGFPHMPGNDYVTSYPLQGEDNDGGSLQ